jgi:hypothetical protein
MARVPLVSAAKVLIGDVDTSVGSLGDLLGLQSGTLVNPGVSFFGAKFPTGIELGTVTIGPAVAIPGVTLPFSLSVIGFSNFVGTTDIFGIENVFAFSNVFGATSRVGAKFATAFNFDSGLKIQAAVNISQGAKLCQAFAKGPLFNAAAFVGNVVGTTGINKEQAAAINSKKPFDIPHPTKEGWRLRHVCIEGPTADVYVRGKLKDSNVIELPEYWRKLVHPETITVNLTPIGTHQELYVDKIEWGTRITIKTNSGSSINCYYTVCGERADTDKNISEYEGTYDDYPGDNRQYTSSGTSAVVQ